MGEILKTVKLSKNFGGLCAILDVNFSVKEGDHQSIIGPNGAGKSTFFKLITGDLKPSSGKITFLNKDITFLPSTVISHLGIAVAYQITNIFPMLTVFENIRVAAQSRKTTFNLWAKASSLRDCNEKALALLEEINLSGMKDVMADNLSHGDRKRLEIGIALATQPRLLLLDEPTAGLSPKETRETIELIKRIGKNLTIVMVEHKMKVVMEVSNKITVLHYGKVIAQGKPDEIRSNEEVRKVYLGGVKI
jgi:branched-chain amino acid transport system ATP-binding protein